jgi:hypothetical protein
MLASERLKMKMNAANTYKSKWQSRDASEVTLRVNDMANKNRASNHQGPNPETCSKGNCPTLDYIPSPGSGYSKTWTTEGINPKAGCADCADPNWGAPFGITLKTCAEIETILELPANPIKGTRPIYGNLYPVPVTAFPCLSPGIVPSAKAAQIESQCRQAKPDYTGWRNQVPASGNGHVLNQVPSYPSG